jgi:hypothetical protein
MGIRQRFIYGGRGKISTLERPPIINISIIALDDALFFNLIFLKEFWGHHTEFPANIISCPRNYRNYAPGIMRNLDHIKLNIMIKLNYAI